MFIKKKYHQIDKYGFQRYNPEDKRYQSWATFINSTGIIFAFSTILFPEPHPLFIGILIIQPILCLGLLHCFSGKIVLEAGRSTNQPQLLPAFLAPFIFLALRAMMDCHILFWTHFWVPFILFSLIIFGLVIWLAIGLRSPILLFIFCLIYGYGATVILNKTLEPSVYQVYQVQVFNKSVSHSAKGFDTYYLTVSPWGPIQSKQTVLVQKKVYIQRNIGDTAKIYLYQGKFNIPWYEVK